MTLQACSTMDCCLADTFPEQQSIHQILFLEKKHYIVLELSLWQQLKIQNKDDIDRMYRFVRDITCEDIVALGGNPDGWDANRQREIQLNLDYENKRKKEK
jgi:hypothetical protein